MRACGRALMPNLKWYWHRLRMMSVGEMALHVRKKLRHIADARGLQDWSNAELVCSGVFPALPKPGDAPLVLSEALRRDLDNILAGRWKAFGHLDIQVDDPPRWQKDYLAGVDLSTSISAFKLNHRELPGGADIKLVWELSRWYSLTRLAMAAYVLGEERAARKCLDWLEDWVRHNPPYRGWNWTSALEVGMRLIQFTWIDALLGGSTPFSSIPEFSGRLARLRREILPAHGWYAWRHRSFGSSANNHLLGELAGLILAVARWPALTQWCAPLDTLQKTWQREVLAQFAEDGGNKEQALNYQLFSWELCWQTFKALEAADRGAFGDVEQWLSFAARFFWETQARLDPWDYGDSDNAFAVPVFANEGSATQEWHQWLEAPRKSEAISYWLGDSLLTPPLRHGEALRTIEVGEWWLYRHSGIAICESGFWFLRWDLSPLGYLSTAAHGHLDALHLSIWFKGVALVIDPGTGAYYADKRLRNWLASRTAHNAPCPSGPEWPQRLGPFLWAEQHPTPTIKEEPCGAVGVLNLPHGQLRRTIASSPAGLSWVATDQCLGNDGSPVPFTVRWQFAPESYVKRLNDRRFLIKRHDVEIEVQASEAWNEVKLVEIDEQARVAVPGDEASLEGVVSPSFRKTVRAPYLKLTARPGEGRNDFHTTFLVAPNKSSAG